MDDFKLSWNLTETVVWIATRSSTEQYRLGGSSLLTLTLATEDDLPGDALTLSRIQPAMAELWHNLDHGTIEATGVLANGKRVIIERSLWHTLSIRDDSLADYNGAHQTALVGDDTLFENVLFRSADVLALWATPETAYLTRALRDAETKTISDAKTPPQRRDKSSYKIEQIERAANALWPNGILPTSVSDLIKPISRHLKDNNEEVPSRSTFERFFKSNRGE